MGLLEEDDAGGDKVGRASPVQLPPVVWWFLGMAAICLDAFVWVMVMTL
jgi:hypothetical protein